MYETEKLMKEHKDIISGDQKKKLDDAIEKVKDALKRDDFEAMQSSEQQLTEVWHGVSSDIYAKAREKSGAGAAPGQGPGRCRAATGGVSGGETGGRQSRATSWTPTSRWWTTTRRSSKCSAIISQRVARKDFYGNRE